MLPAEAQGIRKGALVTTSVIAVYASTGASDVNWIVSLSGWKAWGFILLVHCYFSVSWYFHRNTYIRDNKDDVYFQKGELHRKGSPRPSGIRTSGSVDRYLGGRVDGGDARQVLTRRLTDIACLVGLGIAGGSFAYRFYEFLSMYFGF